MPLFICFQLTCWIVTCIYFCLMIFFFNQFQLKCDWEIQDPIESFNFESFLWPVEQLQCGSGFSHQIEGFNMGSYKSPTEQWWSTIFHWSISLASWWTRIVSNCINWFALSSLGRLSASYTFWYYLAFLHGYNRPSHCIYGDKTTTSRCWIPFHIEVHLSSFWNYCYWATLHNNHLSLLAIHG